MEAPECAYIFSPSDNPGATLDFESLIGWIDKAFRGDSKRGWYSLDPTFHYHRLRHSFCNLVLLKLWPGCARVFVHLLSGRHIKTKEWLQDSSFRADLFGTGITASDMQAIALLMGHGSAATSLEHYTHVLDFYEDPDTWNA
jgi:integrase